MVCLQNTSLSEKEYVSSRAASATKKGARRFLVNYTEKQATMLSLKHRFSLTRDILQV